MLNVVYLEINEDETAQNAVVKYQVNAVMAVIDRDSVLPSYEGKAFA
jgi:hypothetical protein